MLLHTGEEVAAFGEERGAQMLLTFLPMSLLSAIREAGSWSPGSTFRGQDSHYSPFLPARTLQWKRPACRQVLCQPS